MCTCFFKSEKKSALGFGQLSVVGDKDGGV